MLEIVAKAKTLGERARLIEKAQSLLERRRNDLKRRKVDPKKLLLKRRLTKEIDDYKAETRTAIAARQLKDSGIRAHPGEQVSYLITNARAKEKSNRIRAEETSPGYVYDADEYIKLLNAAAAELKA
jgi:DNA polymerase elongation subunit (family B)